MIHIIPLRTRVEELKDSAEAKPTPAPILVPRPQADRSHEFSRNKRTIAFRDPAARFRRSKLSYKFNNPKYSYKTKKKVFHVPSVRSKNPTRIIVVSERPFEYELYVDGACWPNPGNGGWGAVLIKNGEKVAQDFGRRLGTTNNQMELMAIEKGLSLIPLGKTCRISSDSQYAINCITIWARKWERYGWKRNKKAELKNKELIQKIYEMTKGMDNIFFRWIKGHSGDKWGDYADQLSGDVGIRHWSKKKREEEPNLPSIEEVREIALKQLQKEKKELAERKKEKARMRKHTGIVFKKMS